MRVKLKKSQLKELIRQAIVEDIMDKEIKNPKTGNKIKVRTALQLPGDHPANKMAKKLVAKSPIKKDKTGDDVGGPAYPNVPKGAKTSKQAKQMKAAREKNIEKTDDVARSMGYKHTAEIVKDGSSDEIMDFMDAIEDKGQDFDKADELLNLVRDNEQGVRDDDDDVVMDYKKGIFKALTTPGVKGKGSGKSGKDIEKQAMSAADAANAKMDKDEKISKTKDYLKDLQKALKGAEPGSAFASMYQDNIKKAKETLKKLQTESKKRRYTVKEVRMWMKKLEENRYKKVYNSDARRVAWMVNNEGVSLDEMPMSMKKKWSKAQYGRERYLATEFLKSKSEQLSEGLDLKKLETAIKDFQNKIKKQGRVTNARDEEHLKQLIKVYKQMGGKKIKEQKLREQIREIIEEQLNEAYRSQSIFFDKKDKSKLEKLLKKNKGKFPFNPPGESVVNWSLNDRGSKGLEWGGIPKSKYNKAVEFFMKNKLNPRG